MEALWTLLELMVRFAVASLILMAIAKGGSVARRLMQPAASVEQCGACSSRSVERTTSPSGADVYTCKDCGHRGGEGAREVQVAEEAAQIAELSAARRWEHLFERVIRWRLAIADRDSVAEQAAQETLIETLRCLYPTMELAELYQSLVFERMVAVAAREFAEDGTRFGQIAASFGVMNDNERAVVLTEWAKRCDDRSPAFYEAMVRAVPSHPMVAEGITPPTELSTRRVCATLVARGDPDSPMLAQVLTQEPDDALRLKVARIVFEGARTEQVLTALAAIEALDPRADMVLVDRFDRAIEEDQQDLAMLLGERAEEARQRRLLTSGGLSVASEEEGGGLSVAYEGAGALSRVAKRKIPEG